MQWYTLAISSYPLRNDRNGRSYTGLWNTVWLIKIYGKHSAWKVLYVTKWTLIARSDSCCGQNKNFLLLSFWQYLLAKKKFDCIEHKFPEPRHSYLDSDTDFGHIELAVKRQQNVYSVDEYCDIMMHSSSKPRPVITCMGDKMCDIACLPTMLTILHQIINAPDPRNWR